MDDGDRNENELDRGRPLFRISAESDSIDEVLDHSLFVDAISALDGIKFNSKGVVFIY